MPKHFDAFYRDDWYLISISRQQFRVGLDVDFLQRVEVGTIRADHLLPHFFAEVATRSRVKNHLCFFFHVFLQSLSLPTDFSNYPLANAAAKDV